MLNYFLVLYLINFIVAPINGHAPDFNLRFAYERMNLGKKLGLVNWEEDTVSEENVQPCCFPPTWQGIMYRYFSLDPTEIFFKFYEDVKTQNVAIDVVITALNGTVIQNFTQIIHLDGTTGTGMTYIFDKNRKICQSGKVYNATYDQITLRCVAKDATYAGEFPLGIAAKGGASLSLRSWMWKPLPEAYPDIHLERLVTKDCAPTMDIIRGNIAGQYALQTDYYFKIETKVDPRVFVPPSYCKQSDNSAFGKLAKRSVGDREFDYSFDKLALFKRV